MSDFDALYSTYSRDVYRFALYLSGNHAEADDITAETFARAWAGWNSVQVETVRGYLFAIAKNIFLKSLRHKHEPPPDELLDPAIPAQQVLESRQELQTVLGAIQTFDPVDRAALVLRTVNKLPYAEVARILAISETAAKVKVYRARARLLKMTKGQHV